jgi:hypothetical protein
LVLNVRDLFDTLDQCFNVTVAESIMTSIEDSADSILDRNCRMFIWFFLKTENDLVKSIL